MFSTMKRLTRTAAVMVSASLLLTGASECESEPEPEPLACDARVISAPKRVDLVDDRVGVQAVIAAICNVPPPRRHFLKIWLERQQESGRWLPMHDTEYKDIPPPDWKQYPIIALRCEDGWWRVRFVVTGQDQKGKEFRFDPPEGPVRRKIEC